MLSEGFVKQYPTATIKKIVKCNYEPINERKLNLIEVLIEIESDKNVSRNFRKSNSESYIYFNPQDTENPNIKISLTDNFDDLKNNWYEVDGLFSITNWDQV